jgi:type I restriction enzyme S subunit
LSEYFLLLSRTREYAHYIHSITKPAVNQASFTTKDFKRFRFALPPLSEQRKIVDILGTWDQAIALTERRTEAARQRKEGLMQRLLTGRARFPEFEREEWRTVRFHDVFQRVTRKNESENQNVLTMSAQLGLVSQTEYFNKRVASKTLSHYYLLKTGEFAYNKSYSSGYPFGAVKRLDAHKEGVLSTLYICFRLRNAARYDSDFFTHFFEAGQLNKGIYAIAQEGARNHGLLNISISGFFDLTMTVPSYEEQKRIASVLNACDREIELLTQKHDALQRQKKGLMQRLLTGRVRVEV